MLVRAATAIPIGLILGLLSASATDGPPRAAAGAAVHGTAARGVGLPASSVMLRGRVLLPDDGSPLHTRDRSSSKEKLS